MLRRHVLQRAHDKSAVANGVSAVGQFGHAKINNLQARRTAQGPNQEQVIGLDIAMDGTGLMHGNQAHGCLTRHEQGEIEIQIRFPSQQLAKRFTWKRFHYQEWLLVGGGTVIQNSDHIWMRYGGDRMHFMDETRAKCRICGGLGSELLQHDLLPRLNILGKVDDRRHTGACAL